MLCSRRSSSSVRDMLRVAAALGRAIVGGGLAIWETGTLADEQLVSFSAAGVQVDLGIEFRGRRVSDFVVPIRRVRRSSQHKTTTPRMLRTMAG
jgi:hypothetical protein